LQTYINKNAIEFDIGKCPKLRLTVNQSYEHQDTSTTSFQTYFIDISGRLPAQPAKMSQLKSPIQITALNFRLRLSDFRFLQRSKDSETDRRTS